MRFANTMRTAGCCLLGALAGCTNDGGSGGGRLEEWACVPQPPISVAPNEQIDARVTPTEVVNLVAGTFTGTVTWTTQPPEEGPDFEVVSSVEGTSAALTVTIMPDLATARLVDYEYTLVKEGDIRPEIGVVCGSTLVIDALLEVESDEGALAESRMTTVEVGLPGEEVADHDPPWTLKPVIKFDMEADASWQGSLESWAEGGTGDVSLDGQSLNLQVEAPGDLTGAVWADYMEIIGIGGTVWGFKIGTIEATREDPPPG